jgi:hypothetical protein
MATTAIEIAQRYGSEIYAIDMDKTALSHARDNVIREGLERQIHVMEANANKLPFPDNSFDVVINEAMLTIKDRGEPIALATYGELFSIDRQTIINDDLDMLTRIPQAMGLAARATVGDLVWAVLTSNPKMSDGKPLFHADHGNLVSADLSIEGLDTARKAMLLQKSGDRRLNIRPAYMLTPVAIESRANQLIKSASVPGADANSGIVNPIQNFVTVASEARLDDSSSTDFYLTAAQGRDTIEVAYLDGIDTPYLEQQQGFTVDGAAFKVRIDAGVAPLDWRGMVKATKK